MDRLFLFPNTKIGYAYHTLGSRSKKRWNSASGQCKSLCSTKCSGGMLQKKSGAGGKPAPLLMENLQGESMSVFEEQFRDRRPVLSGSGIRAAPKERTIFAAKRTFVVSN